MTIRDLESVNAIVEAKLNELRLVGKSKKQTPEQEHKGVRRVLSDVIEILLANFEASEAVPLF